ncbi:MAG: hypothetical protein ACLP50_14640 [Solirubrobacteraceae bacterium]
MGTGRPQIIDEILQLNGDALALWLLRELDEAPTIQKGENYISEHLAEWFPDSRRIGAKQQLNQFGIPTATSTEPGGVERRLREAYSLLMSRNWIRPDPQSGKSFCDITGEGQRQLASAPGDTIQVNLRAGIRSIASRIFPARSEVSVPANHRGAA